MYESVRSVSSHKKSSRMPKIHRKDSNKSAISDIVKRKKITFLKSAELFAEEDAIFGKTGLESPKLV